VERYGLDAAGLQELVDACRECCSACEITLDRWSGERNESAEFGKFVAAASTFAVIADQLETGGTIPPGLVAFAVTLAATTCQADATACCACSAVSSWLPALLDCGPGDATVG
jgi:hypothetical protein